VRLSLRFIVRQLLRWRLTNRTVFSDLEGRRFAAVNFAAPLPKLVINKCRAAQLAAIAEGRHASRFTRKSTGAETPQPEMNASEIRQKFNTLDKAVIEIERLQNPS